MATSDQPFSAAAPREAARAEDNSTFGTFGDINFLGLWTLYQKEVRRFIKVISQTLLAPVVTTLVFLFIFSLALGRADRVIHGVSFLEFLAPGLIMMTMVQNSFQNTASSLIISKVQGNIVDLLMPPLGPGELMGGMVAGAVTRGLLVGLAVGLAMWPFVPNMGIAYPLLALVYALLANIMLGLLGFLGGLWAEKFDQAAALTNFVITPLSFLSGTFYSIEQLPGPALVIAYANPFFYMIDGLRYAFIGESDGSVRVGLAVLVATNVVLAVVAHRLVKRGYRLKV